MWSLSKPIRVILVLLGISLFGQLAQAKYGGGSGTAEDPYQIATAADLLLLGESPEDYDKHFILTADIDLDPKLPDGKVFDRAVIAPDTDPNDTWGDFQGTSFTGVFDGNGHTISHLTIQGENNLGLFGQLESAAEVRALALTDVNIVGCGDRVGALAGTNAGRVTNCSSTGMVRAGYDVGGLVGVNGLIVGVHKGVTLYAAGTMTECFSTCVVIGAYSVGGLAGSNPSWMGHIVRCFSTGAVSGTGRSVGGLVGYNGGPVTDCYSKGSVTGAFGVGGLVGDNSGTYGEVNGEYGLITMCYSVGSVAGTGSVGGLVGCGPEYEVIDDVIASFWDTQTSDQATSAGGTGKTTAEMQTAGTFLEAGWDFVGQFDNGTEDIWAICEGVDYPHLAWEFVIGDFDADADTDFADFCILAEHWLAADGSFWCGQGCDLTNDGSVDFDDLNELARNWLTGLVP